MATIMTSSDVLQIARRAAAKVVTRFPNIDPETVARAATALAKVESSFRPSAKAGTTTARGLMQITIGTQKGLEKVWSMTHDPERVFDPYWALFLGETYLIQQYIRYRDWPRAVHAYHSGSYPGPDEHLPDALVHNKRWKEAYTLLFGALPANAPSLPASDQFPIFPLIVTALTVGAVYVSARLISSSSAERERRSMPDGARKR